MDFDQAYDEMLHNEFGSSGAHAAAGVAPVSRGRVQRATRVRGQRRAACRADIDPRPARSLVDTTAPSLPRRRDPRRRGGAGPRRGGDGGSRAIAMPHWSGPVDSPARQSVPFSAVSAATSRSIPRAVRPLASAAGPSQQLATAVDQAYRVASGGGSADATTAWFSPPSGALAQGGDPLQWLTTSGSGNVSVAGSPATASDQPGLGAVGSGSGLLGLGLGCTTESDLGVGCILGSVTSALGGLGSASSDPTVVVDELLPSLNGVVSDVTGMLSDLGALLPIGSLPTAGLPPAVLEELGLGSLLGPGSRIGRVGVAHSSR